MRQIAIAAIFGLALIGVGLRLVGTDREYASLLPAAGVIVLYLTAFAAHGIYHLLDFGTALAATGLVSAACIGLYFRLRHDIYSIVAAIGAYSSPIILGLGGEPAFLLFYFLFCSVAFAAISVWAQTRTLTLVAAYLAIVVTAAIGFTLGQDALVATVMALHFLVFAVGAFAYSQARKEVLTAQEAWCFMPLLIAFYALEYVFIGRIAPLMAPWLSLGFAGLLIALYAVARRPGSEAGALPVITTFAALVVMHSGYIVLLPAALHPWLFPVLVLLAAFAPKNLAEVRRIDGFAAPRLALWLVLIVEFVNLLYGLLVTKELNPLAASLAAFASLWVAIIRRGDADGQWRYVLLGVAHVLAIAGLYRLAAEVGSLAVSASWLIYAVAVMVLAFARRDEVMAKSALIVLALAAGKALLYDAAAAPTVVRILCLLLTGVVLYGCGLLMRRIGSWSKDST